MTPIHVTSYFTIGINRHTHFPVGLKYLLEWAFFSADIVLMYNSNYIFQTDVFIYCKNLSDVRILSILEILLIVYIYIVHPTVLRAHT